MRLTCIPGHRCSLEPLEDRRLLAWGPELVATFPGGAGAWTLVGDTLFFAAADGVHGRELWKTDGTSPGTLLVKDIAPGADSSDPTYLESHGALYFDAWQSTTGATLRWTSDGTEAGTVPVVGEIPPEAFGVRLGAYIYFAAWPAEGLWRSGGTTQGRELVKDIQGQPYDLMPVGDILFFRTHDKSSETERLWRSDGTPEGTFALSSEILLYPALTGSSRGHYQVAIGGLLYVVDLNNVVWQSDGTVAGTRPIVPYDGSDATVQLFRADQTLVIIESSNGGAGPDPLLRLRSTEGVAIEVLPLLPPEATLAASGVSNAVGLDGEVYVVLQQAQHYELWATDEATHQARFVRALETPPYSHPHLRLLGGALIVEFLGGFGLPFGAPWVSDGTSLGTLPLPVPGTQLYEIQQSLLFATYDDLGGTKLWKLPSLPGDTNFDGRVNLSDFGHLKANFGRVGENLLGELDYDGDVDLDDFGILKANFGVVGDTPLAPPPAPMPERSQAVRAAAVDRALAALGLAWHAASDRKEELP